MAKSSPAIKPSPARSARPTRRKTPISDARILAGLEALGYSGLGLIELFDRYEDSGFWIKDTKGRFLWVNTAFVIYNGFRHRSEILGLTDFDLCAPALATQYRMDDEKVLKGGRISSRIEMIGRFDHSMHWSVTSKIPIRNRKGRIIGTAGMGYPYKKGDGKVPDESPLAGAMKLITERFHEPFDRRDLAKRCGMSLRDFHRKFRDAYHVTPHDYVRQLRVRASCNALVFSQKTLARIASEFGFSDQSHFTREFHRLIGEPPGVYRARHQR
jgi:AraC-like DNA-binding protein